MMTQQGPQYAYYSQTAVDQCKVPVGIWRKRDGTTLEATAVYENVQQARNYQWEDKKFVGVVYEFVGVREIGQMDGIPF